MKKSIFSAALILAIMLSVIGNIFAATNTDWESEMDVVGVAVVNGTYYDTLQEAVNKADGNIVTLLKDSAEAIDIDGELHLELNGFSATNVSATKIYAYDASATTTAAGTGKLVTTSLVEKFSANQNVRYIALQDEEGTYSFHTFALRITKISLRTTKAGIYYKAVATCDPVLQAAIDSYGVALSLNSMPGADFATASGVSYTGISGAPTSGETFTSGSVFGIFKDGRGDNAARGESKIYANAYLRLADGTVLMANDREDAIGWSMKDVLTVLNENFAQLEATEQMQVKNFCTTWKDATEKWNLNIIAAA